MCNAGSHCDILGFTASDSINDSNTLNCKKWKRESPICLTTDIWMTVYLFLSQKPLYLSKFMGKMHAKKKSQTPWRVLSLFFCYSEEKKKEDYVSFSLVTNIFSTSQPSFIFNDWWYEDRFCHYTAWTPSGPELKKANISYITLENTSVFCCPLNYHQYTASEKMKKWPRLRATELGCLL